LQKLVEKGGLTSFRAIAVTLVILSWLCAFSSPVFAEEEEVYFQSDYQQEIHDEKILILQGNVEVHFRDMIIYAEEVRLNDEKDEFFGVGDVHLVSPDRDIFSDSIWFNYGSDDFDMANARGSMLTQGVGEPVWFEADRLKGNINDYKMINGIVSTCTPTEHREYHLEARSIKVMPGNKIIFRNGYTFILNVPVLWFPYWSYSLADTPWEIEVGKKRFDGTYVKAKYNYLDEEQIIGALLMHYYSQRGYRFGAQHEYLVQRHGVGKLNWSYLYGTFRSENTGEFAHANEYSVNLSQPVRFGDRFSGTFSFATNSRYNIRQGRSNDYSGTFNGSYNTQDTRTSFNVNARGTSGVSQSTNITTGLTHNRTIFGDVTSSARINYTVTKQNNSGSADEAFKANLEFRQNNQGWNWNAKIDTHWDPDGFTNPGDRNRSYTDRLPEINVTIQPNAFDSKYRNLLGFGMQNLTLLGGLYYIGPENKEINGFYGRINTRFTRNFNLSTAHRIQSNVDFWQAISSTGDARYVYSTQANWTWDIAKKIKWQLNWNRSDNEGRIPLQGLDKAGSPSNRLTWNLNYQNGRLYTIRLSTNYVLREAYAPAPGELLTIKRLGQLSLSFNYTPSPGTRFTLRTDYNFQNKELNNITSSFSTTDHRSFDLTTNITYSTRDSEFTRLNTKATFVIGDDWDFVVDTEFGSQSTGSPLRTVKITHRLDCTYLSINYGAQNDYFSITWAITGMPSARLGWSTTEDAFGPDFLDTFDTGGGGLPFGGGSGYR